MAPRISGSMNTVPVPVPGAAPNSPQAEAGLKEALRNYPPLIVGGNVQPVLAPGSVMPRACPDPGARVEQKGGPTLEYLGSSPRDGNLCRMRVAGTEFEAWYGIWLTSWPGAETGYRALQRVFNSRTGDAVGFDVVVDPQHQWHDIIRHEGVEDIRLLGNTYRAVKISHYREGFGGNIYRSVATVWKDVPTGMLIYATYQHISGSPVIDDPLIPTAIIPAPVTGPVTGPVTAPPTALPPTAAPAAPPATPPAAPAP